MKFVFTILALLLSLSALAEPTSTTVIVEGMTCASCARAIEKSLKKFPEVDSVKISINSEKVTLTFKEGKSLAHGQISQAIKEAGYKVKPIADSKQN